MPRIPFSLLKRARELDPLLVLLLRTTRCLRSARNELRWLKEHSSTLYESDHPLRKTSALSSPYSGSFNASSFFSSAPGSSAAAKSAIAGLRTEWLRRACLARGRGTPLQYILGTTFFGDLELWCRRGVLIPREETAEITSFLVQRLRQENILQSLKKKSRSLRVLDLCTGTGCMALLFSHNFLRSHSHSHISDKTNTKTRLTKKVPLQSAKPRLADTSLTVLGVDFSQRALHCARANLARLRQQQLLPPSDNIDVKIGFAYADVLSYNQSRHLDSTEVDRGEQWDIILANPPYISAGAYLKTTTERSVRGFEPQAALVPPGADADLFYKCILQFAETISAKIVLFEVGDMQQAQRVADLALSQNRPAAERHIEDDTRAEAVAETEARLESATWAAVEVWHDGVSYYHRDAFATSAQRENRKKVLGPPESDARAVLCFTEEAKTWLSSP